MAQNPIVTFEIEMETDFGTQTGTIKAELYPDKAPNTVNNFISLINKGYYNGLTFHRIISGFMIQGGDPLGNGTGGSEETIKGEFSQNGVSNPIPHRRGVLSMARSSAMDSASSQFFIMHDVAPHLDGQYAAFGKVTEGIDVVDAIASTKCDWNDKPRKAQRMAKVTVETFGVDYPAPEQY